MNDEKTKTDETPETVEAEKPVSIVDEARAIRDEIIKQKEELKAENDRKEKINSEGLLSGTSGGHVDPKPAEESNKDYVERIKKAGWKDERRTDD